MSLQKMKAILRHNGYKLFTRPYELNIVGLRSKSIVPNRFDDEIHVFYKVSALNWHYHVFKATTDPGTYWLKQPMQPQGTAILAQGQYVDCYELGLHRGQYTALVQRKPITILRDYNRDAILDFINGTKLKGLFGVNIHRANKTGETKTVDKYSAGCQVFENADDFNFFIRLCENHRSRYGNHFSYTLIDFRAVQRQNLRYLVSGIGLLGLAGAGILVSTHRAKLSVLTSQIKSLFKKFTPNKQKNEQLIQTNIPSTPTG